MCCMDTKAHTQKHVKVLFRLKYTFYKSVEYAKIPKEIKCEKPKDLSTHCVDIVNKSGTFRSI